MRSRLKRGAESAALTVFLFLAGFIIGGELQPPRLFTWVSMIVTAAAQVAIITFYWIRETRENREARDRIAAQFELMSAEMLAAAIATAQRGMQPPPFRETFGIESLDGRRN